ncbi:hypothetical protein GCM10029964_112620 [Kibdelosporangium lantanae]
MKRAMPPRFTERVRHNDEVTGTTTETQPPDRVIAGRYRLLSLVGHGSMGTVWRAYDEYLRRPVAVKEVRLPPGMPEEEADELRERTMREARAIAVLSHPNVVTLHDIAREDDNPFVVMEYVPGSSLADIMRVHGPWTTRRPPRSRTRWPPRCRPRTRPASRTGTSNRRTCWSPRTAGSSSPTSASPATSPNTP